MLLASSFYVNAGQDKFNGPKTIKAAEKAMSEGDIYQAADLYEEVIKNDGANKDVAFRLGIIYFTMRDYKNAEKYFEIAASSESKINVQPTAGYYYALMMKMNGKYEDAKKTFEAFKKSFKSDIPGFDKKWIDKEIEGCVMAINKAKVINNLNVKHPGKELNSSYADQAPVKWDSSTLVFATIQSDTVVIRDKNNHFLHFYQSKVDNGTFSNSTPFDNFKTEGKHVTNGSMSPDHKKFFFNICSETKEHTYHCEIYRSDLKDGVWQAPVRLPDNVNDPKYTNTQPTLGYYKENKEVLYFSSDRAEGKGRMDLWFSTIDRNGAYSDPKNCGSKINTNRDEETPFYDVNTGTLYFSSNGLKSFGGFDIFSATGSLTTWSPPENIGSPINSSTDDKYFQPEKGGKTGYFVSNRPGTYSIRSETCCPDIFTYEYFNVIHVAVKGKVYEKSDSGTKLLDDVRILISELDEDNNNEAVLFNEQNFSKGIPYFSSLKLSKQYKVTATKEGYLSNSVTFNTNNITKSDTLVRDLNLSKIDRNKAYRLNNIYYDFDKWNLRESSKNTLDSLYNIMIENPLIIVELGSHTDSRGTDEYNLDLSQKRAESCVNYLIERGIPKNRIQPKGYGESKQLEDCSKHPECPTSSSGDCDCHQLNRRTEFRIIGELDAKMFYNDKRSEDKK